MNADILKVSTNRAQAAVALRQDDANNVESVIQELKEEQEGWDEEMLDDGVIQMLHNQFADLVFEASLDLWVKCPMEYDSNILPGNYPVEGVGKGKGKGRRGRIG